MIKIWVKVLISKLRYYASKGWYQRQLLRILYILILLPSDGCNIALGSKQISIFMTNCLIELFKSSVTNSSILFQNTPNEYINQVPLALRGINQPVWGSHYSGYPIQFVVSDKFCNLVIDVFWHATGLADFRGREFLLLCTLGLHLLLCHPHN